MIVDRGGRLSTNLSFLLYRLHHPDPNDLSPAGACPADWVHPEPVSVQQILAAFLRILARSHAYWTYGILMHNT